MLLKFFGFFPFSIDFAKKTDSITAPDILQLTLTLIIWFSIAAYRVIKSGIFDDKGSRFGKFGESAGGLSGVLILTGTIVGNLINRRKLMDILESFDKFDEKVCLLAFSKSWFQKLKQFNSRSNN